MSSSGNGGDSARATMVDVAEAAGVSLKTVSRVINGEPGVRPDTVQRVLEASAELRYARNDLAASLRHGVRSFTLGLVIEDVANPFYSSIAQAVEDSARERSTLLITASAREDPARERDLVTALLRRRVDALLVVPTGSDHRYIGEAGFDTKIVFVDRPPAKTKADTVLGENAPGAVAPSRTCSRWGMSASRSSATICGCTRLASGLPATAKRSRRPVWRQRRSSCRSATARLKPHARQP